jgi:hypothetical protein
MTPNILLATARVSLRVNRNRPLRRAMRAWSRGPKAPFGEPAGIPARVVLPHFGHRFDQRRNSCTKAWNSGVSVTWRMQASNLG